jgi:hypothetical protein
VGTLRARDGKRRSRANKEGDGGEKKKKKRKPRKKKPDTSITEAQYLASCASLDAVSATLVCDHFVVPVLLKNMDDTYRGTGGPDGPAPMRTIMSIVYERLASVREIIFEEWQTLVRIFKVAFHHPVKASRNSAFLRRLSDFRTQSILPSLLAFLFPDINGYPRAIFERDMQSIGTHILHLLVQFLYSTTRVDLEQPAPALDYPHPSAQCMIGGWAIFSTVGYYRTLQAKAHKDRNNERENKWKAMADLVTKLSVPAAEVASHTGPLTSKFFMEYNRGNLRLPRAQLLILFADIHFRFLKLTERRIRETTFQLAERAILTDAIFNARFVEICTAALKSGTDDSLGAPLLDQNADIVKHVYKKLALKFLHVREAQYLRRSNADVGMTLALRTMLASTGSRVQASRVHDVYRDLPTRLSPETVISVEALPLVDDAIGEEGDGLNSSGSDSSTTDEEQREGTALVPDKCVVRSLDRDLATA